MNHDLPRGHLDLLLLATVASRPAHGYAIIAALREQSGGTFDLLEGTVYPALHRLERSGLLQSHWAAGSGRSRRIYEINAQGQTALVAQRQAWQTFASGIQAVLGGAA